MAVYSPQVERWRPLVEKYFPPELVDKALYVIQGESGGNPVIRGDGGVAIGLFQIQDNRNFAGRPSAEQLEDPEFNIRYAAQQLGAANNKWTDWGEGSTYNGQPFGALGHNPYPGDSGDYSQVSNTWDATQQLPFSQQEYQQKVARYLYLESKLNNYDPYDQESYDGDYDADLQEWSQVAAEIQAYDTVMAQGGTGIDDEIARGRYRWETDPRRIDAENSANAWARQQQINQQALTSTQNDLAEQRLTQDSANAETQAYKQSSIFGAPMGFRVGATDLPTEEELFQKNIDRASKNLPEVTPIPYAPALGAFGAPRAPSSGGGSTGQSFGKIPTEKDIRSALHPPQQMPGGTTITSVPGGARIGAGSFASEAAVGSFGKRFTAPIDMIRNALADTQRSTTPGATRLPTPSAPPLATGTPTPYSSVSNPSLPTSVRRFVGSLFNGRRY